MSETFGNLDDDPRRLAVGLRVRRGVPLLEGEPIVIVSNRRVHARTLRNQRMTVEEVEEVEAGARQQQITSLDEVRFAVLESNGKISFATK